MNRLHQFVMLASLALLSADAPPERAAPRIVGHRGLVRHAPENTLAGFSACIDLRLGFELDVRRTRDGHLVCMHDADVKRTTGGTGKVNDLTLAELRKLDAGQGFDPTFVGERVPTMAEVFALLQQRHDPSVLVALDIKDEDDALAGDLIGLAKKHGVLSQVVCIGTAIEDPAVRRRLKAADPAAPVAVLAKTTDDLPVALKDRDADWIYVRFIPSAEQVARIHAAGRRVFLVGKLVSGNEPENWRQALHVGADALLTDYPLECRQVWRERRAP